MLINNGQNRETPKQWHALYTAFTPKGTKMRLVAELLPDSRREVQVWTAHCETLRTHYPVTRHSVLPQIIYACHYGIFKQESPAVEGKPRDTAAILFGLKFADDIHYKFKSSQASKARLQSSKHTDIKQNLTQNGDSRSFKVTCFNCLRYFAAY